MAGIVLIATQWFTRRTTIDSGGGGALQFPLKSKGETMKSLTRPMPKANGAEDVPLESPRMPPLIMVRAFEAAARAGSMRKAADDIGVSHTVISRHVRNLEVWSGRKLLDTGPRGTLLTQEGAIFYRAVSEAFQIIAAAAVELRPRTRRGMLRIWAMPGLATRWLAPRLSEIERTLAGADIVLRAIDRLPDFSKSEADVMIGFGSKADLPAGATWLISPRAFPVASKVWIEKNGQPENLAELSRLPLIHEESRQQWTNWFKGAGYKLRTALKGPLLWDANMAIDAALAGQGIVLASRLTVAREIDGGNLVELLGTNVKLNGYYLHIRPERSHAPLIEGFRLWLEDGLRKEEQSRQDLKHVSVHHARS
ncbi:LysR substrate-binding domain-containing protein [Bradyrhizobium sp. CCBAU 45384]|uniref:LysR substrate-binding domain-containing protein n=1 Tax=Bradyrhizobium sp. CCBAU 45384 TaxID=858428 RepID=UPI002306C914|nr:LysR substrate-binding domain-containing protein [Bradyrhizobium sp. CCBAU 45384]